MWVDFPRYHATRTPDRIALILEGEGRRLTYADLDREASRWAATFSQKGVGYQDRVALLATNCLEHITMFFACAKLGAIFVPLNFRLGVSELEEQLARLDATLLFGRGSCNLNTEVPYEDLDQFEPDNRVDYPQRQIQDKDTLLMLFTSGSTGTPKGVMLHAEMLLWNMINTHQGWGLLEDDISLVHTPFFHTAGYNITLLPLLRLGGTLIMVDRFDAAEMLELIQRERVSVFFAVPTMFRMMREAEGFADCTMDSLRFCISGGAPCPKSLIEAFRAKGVPMKQGFGLTEVGPNCFAMSDEEARDRQDSVGRPMPHLRVSLLDERGAPVEPGEVGELCFQGPTVCKGYWRMEEVFEELTADGFFHTGDLMRRDAKGFYYVVGRKKDMYISGGENVYPGEVVRQIVKHPAILDALVVAVPHQRWGEVGFAFLRGETMTLDVLRAFLDPLLSRYKHPHHLLFMEQFPLLANNKVDMTALRDKALEVIRHG